MTVEDSHVVHIQCKPSAAISTLWALEFLSTIKDASAALSGLEGVQVRVGEQRSAYHFRLVIYWELNSLLIRTNTR